LLICTLFAFAARGAGSSVLISRDGHLITKEHVIAGCKSLNAATIGPVIAVGHDKVNDLALLKSNATISTEPLPLGTAAVRPGEEVIAVAYPLQGLLGGLNVTNGIVSGLAGTHLQFTAPVQPGNSGGALLDRRGTLIGILSSKLVFGSGGFAVTSEVVQTFLSAQSVTPVLADGKAERSIEDIAELARKSVFAIECLK
jgi:S1-C subfamily serine protease